MVSLTFRKVECWHWSGAADDRPTQRMGRSARRALPEITQSAESPPGDLPVTAAGRLGARQRRRGVPTNARDEAWRYSSRRIGLWPPTERRGADHEIDEGAAFWCADGRTSG